MPQEVRALRATEIAASGLVNARSVDAFVLVQPHTSHVEVYSLFQDVPVDICDFVGILVGTIDAE